MRRANMRFERSVGDPSAGERSQELSLLNLGVEFAGVNKDIDISVEIEGLSRDNGQGSVNMWVRSRAVSTSEEMWLY